MAATTESGRHGLRFAYLALVCGLLCACDTPKPLLDQVRDRGEIVVATRNSPTAYYAGPQGTEGFEYELARRFADHLGVRLKVVIPENIADVFTMVEDGTVDLAAAGLTVTDKRRQRVRFGPVYQHISQQLVYRQGGKRPRRLEDVNGILEVMADSSHVENLQLLRTEHPDLSWQENKNLESEELLTLVYERLIDYTVADSNEVSLNQRFFPELRVAFNISDPQPLAWAFSYKHDYSLHDEAWKFFDQLHDSGELDSLVERYYGHTDNMNYAGWQLFMDHVDNRLVRYQRLFEKAGREHNVDWRLLAAMGYQESLWNPSAKSPTGVRGMMMLTRLTARDLGIMHRTSAEQSVDGGARYVAQLMEKIPSTIEEPDRTWFALAAYNVGFGHLEDARQIAAERGFDPDKWLYVKDSLPLLRKKKWYTKTRHGFARGDEPVEYVQRIRAYYDLLVWMTDEKILVEALREDTPEQPEDLISSMEETPLPSGG